jgi:anion-transporting  ArsA/GET3 family ATPase
MPGRVGLRVLGRGTGLVFSVMKRATGIDMLQDLSEFFRSFGTMSAGFRERAERVNALLADSRTAFVLVTSPAPDAVDEAVFFHHRLLDQGLPFAGVVVNRMHPLAAASGDALPDLLDEDLRRKVLRNLEEYRILAERDRTSLDRLRSTLGRKPMLTVPELDDDIHDLAGLERMNEYLFAG